MAYGNDRIRQYDDDVLYGNTVVSFGGAVMTDSRGAGNDLTMAVKALTIVAAARAMTPISTRRCIDEGHGSSTIILQNSARSS